MWQHSMWFHACAAGSTEMDADQEVSQNDQTCGSHPTVADTEVRLCGR